MMLSKERQEQILEVIFNMPGGYQDVHDHLESHFKRHNEIVEQMGIKEEEEPPVEYTDGRFNEHFERYEERKKSS